MKKTLLLTIALLLSAVSFAQSRGTLLQESFDKKSLPEGWAVFGEGSQNWSVAATDYAGGSPNELDLFWDPNFDGISRMATPPMNLTGISSIAISFKHYFNFLIILYIEKGIINGAVYLRIFSTASSFSLVRSRNIFSRPVIELHLSPIISR